MASKQTLGAQTCLAHTDLLRHKTNALMLLTCNKEPPLVTMWLPITGLSSIVRRHNRRLNSTTATCRNLRLNSTTARCRNLRLSSTTAQCRNLRLNSTTAQCRNSRLSSTTVTCRNLRLSSTTATCRNLMLNSTTARCHNLRLSNTTATCHNHRLSSTMILEPIPVQLQSPGPSNTTRRLTRGRSKTTSQVLRHLRNPHPHRLQHRTPLPLSHQVVLLNLPKPHSHQPNPLSLHSHQLQHRSPHHSLPRHQVLQPPRRLQVPPKPSQMTIKHSQRMYQSTCRKKLTRL